MERLCLDCGEAVKGRTDKKFCDDSCRNNYNNRLKSENGIVFNRINSILKKNRTLLSKFNPDGKVKISRKKMLNAGFNFDYHTHIYQTQNGKCYLFCYEFGYLALNDDDFLLVKREDKL
ncbi:MULTISPECIES: hypothetical protein [unclassified Pedobacter]|uniref:hypothetical protein n=1 Tax=Pedobacter TaxID=84567 RepID=UPI000B4B35E1|nr:MULTISPECIES: hypothetical protein [unclassified Pedobacter]MCX2431274.1 hypothetical protein [Pedobacter sp. GR22-10]OWK71680.1 hypothetical protein CBW18_04220 [Pedobacter sp. AJM]